MRIASGVVGGHRVLQGGHADHPQKQVVDQVQGGVFTIHGSMLTIKFLGGVLTIRFRFGSR